MTDTELDKQIDEIIDKYRKDIVVAANGFDTEAKDSAINVAAYSSILVKSSIKQLIQSATREAKQKGRIQMGEKIQQYSERADFFKPDAQVVLADTMVWLSGLDEAERLQFPQNKENT